MNIHQPIFELWNYTFLFMTIATLCTFTVDFIGHNTKTITSNIFAISVLLGIAVGESVMSFIPIKNLELALSVSILLTMIISTLIPIKFSTTDSDIETSKIKSNNQRN